MKTPTRTQLQIRQELHRRRYRSLLTRQDEYLKFSCAGLASKDTFWVGRRGQLLVGRSLSESSDCDNHSDWWKEIRYAAKKNYVEED